MTISEQPLYYRITVKLLLLGLIIALLIIAQNLIVPLVVAVFFTFLLLPISRRLEKWKVPKVLAILLSILVALAFFGALIYFFSMQVISFIDDWPALEHSIGLKLESFQQFISKTFNVSPIEQRLWITNKLKENASSGGILVLGIFSATGSFLASLTLIPIYIFFLTLYRDKIKEFIRLISKDDRNEHVLMVVKKVSKVSQKYLIGIFLDVLILSILNSTGFLILGLQHAILFGVLASMLNIIPYIGVLIGSSLPILMALLTKDSYAYALGVAGICFFVQFLDNNFITPYVVGSSVSINPFTAILVLIASSMIWGIPGMVLSLPLTGMLKVVCDNVEELKPYGYLLGEEVNYREQEHIQDRLKRKWKK